MVPPLSQQISSCVDNAAQMYHRLVLVAGPPHSGKTAALRQLSDERGWPLVNVNLAISERMLELTVRQRALRIASLFDDVIREQGGDVVLLDNIEMLFHPEFSHNPLRLLQSVSRNRTIVASWRGRIDERMLTYAVPEHPEYRRDDASDTLVVAA